MRVVGGEGAAAMPAASAGVRYAGFWIRFVAAIIDTIIVEAVVVPVSMVLGVVIGIGGTAGGADQAMLQLAGAGVGALVGLVGTLLYYTALESSGKQATLGKMVLGLKVTDTNYQRISIGRAFGRTLSKYVSAMILLIGYIMAGFTERKQALHDLIAGTYVIYSK